MRVLVQGQIANSEHAVDSHCRHSCSTQERINTRSDFIQVEGLCHVVIGTGTQSGNAISHRVTCRQEQDRKVRLALTQAFQGFHSIEAGHLDIQNDHIGVKSIGLIQGFPAIGRGFCLPALMPQGRSQEFSEDRFIVNDKNAHGRPIGADEVGFCCTHVEILSQFPSTFRTYCAGLPLPGQG